MLPKILFAVASEIASALFAHNSWSISTDTLYPYPINDTQYIKSIFANASSQYQSNVNE